MSRFFSPPGRTGVCAAALLLTTTLLVTGCKPGDASEKDAKAGDKKEEKAADAVPVEVAKAARRPVAASYLGTANLEPRAESQVVAKTSGVALQVLVEEGQKVVAGQALVRLDPDRPRLALAQAEAQLRKLENNYQRATRLVGQQLVSAAEVDQLKYDMANARAAYNVAALELSYTTVVAPISGVVASRSIKDGNFVQPDDTTFAAAAAYADWAKAPGFYEVLTNEPGKTSWPITGASFILVQKVQDKPANAAEVFKFFDWAYKNGQKQAADLDYVPMPANVVKLIQDSWAANVRDASGKAIWK